MQLTGYLPAKRCWANVPNKTELAITLVKAFKKVVHLN
jgi:hypothetical protein